MIKKIIKLILFILIISAKNTYANDNLKNKYLKLHFDIGYTYQFYQGYLRNIQKNSTNFVQNIFTNVFIDKKMTNLNHTNIITGNIGIDCFSKISKLVESSIGVNAEIKVPINGDTIIDNSKLITNEIQKKTLYSSIQYIDILNTTLRIGFTFKISKNLKIMPYGFGGIALTLSNTISYENKYNRISPSMVIGRMYLKAYEDLENTLLKIQQAGVNITKQDFYDYGYQYFRLHNITTKQFDNYEDANQYAIEHNIEHYWKWIGGRSDANIVIENEDKAQLLYEDVLLYKIYGEKKGTEILNVSKILFSEGIKILSKEEYDLYKTYNYYKSKHKFKIGFVVGGGINFIINNKFTITPEYKYIEVEYDAYKVKAHNLNIKIGRYIF